MNQEQHQHLHSFLTLTKASEAEASYLLGLFKHKPKQVFNEWLLVTSRLIKEIEKGMSEEEKEQLNELIYNSFKNETAV